LSSRDTFGDGVLLESEHNADFAMREAVPGDQAQQFPVGLSQRIEGTANGLLFFLANDRYVG
jgi:hypothetical protein